MKLDDVLNEDERLDLWIEMSLLATMLQEYTDWWWTLDTGLHRANARRAGIDYNHQAQTKISD